MTNDKRLIEDYLPIQAISAEASGEPRTKGHISTLHVWRARRPLVACRAAVYGALVPASQFVPENGPDNKKQSLGRANAAKFVAELCTYPGGLRVIAQAQKHILNAHADRLTAELAEVGKTGQWPSWVDEFNWPKADKQVTRHDIEKGRAPRPRVLDMFAGGGAIPLEAARLYSETHALDLNPVAYLIELCTVTFPQQFGAGLADDVEKWARRVLDRVRADVSDVLARIPRPGRRHRNPQRQLLGEQREAEGSGELSIVAHYWTRTVPCPNPQCQGTVPLYRQTWLRKKPSGYLALKPIPDRRHRVVRFEVVESESEAGLEFDPGEGSEGSATACPFCHAPVDGPYVRRYGDEKGFGQQLMCVIAVNPDGTGKLYLADESLAHGEEERQAIAEQRAAELERELGSSSLDQGIPPTGNAGLATGKSYLYGIRTFRQAFTPRQRFILLSMAREVHRAYQEMLNHGMGAERAKSVTTYLGLWISRLTDRCNSLCRWNNAREVIQGLTDLKRFAMMWDFPEVNILGSGSGSAVGSLEYITATIRREGDFRNPVNVARGSATELTYQDGYFDAVITDPPYYDNESYSELSDVCYIWLRPTIGFLYPEHFATPLTPKKKECVAAAYRQGGKEAARTYYENCMFQSLLEAHRVSKPGALLVVVYAHKTTLGWATLVDALRRAAYMVTEAWPLDTETKARVAHHGDAALATSIFLIARKRVEQTTGSYDEEVRPELERVIRERVTTLWDMGIGGADLVISCVGAGLRPFSRHVKVEFANGEEVPAERFLAEVEAIVRATIRARRRRELGASAQAVMAHLDADTDFYVDWRSIYRAAWLDAGEAIVFAYGTSVELDGPKGLSTGPRALLEKKGGKYRLRDYSERGGHEKLGWSNDRGEPAPVIDALHRVLWLMENRPRLLTEFLRESRVNREQLRLVAQELAGPALKGGELAAVSGGGELAALTKLTANWKSVIEDAISPLERSAR